MFLPVNITLQFGDTGDFVAELQRRLSMINLFNEAFINATFDSNTVNAVKSFQSMQGLRVDGIAGPETLRRLNGVISGDTSSSGSEDKKEEEQAQQAALLKTAALADMPISPLDPILTAAAPAAEEKPVEKPVEQKPVVAAPPPRADMQADMQAQQQQQQQIDAMKQQMMAQQQQQPDLQAQQQQQMDAIKQQQEALRQEAKQKTSEPKPAEQKPKEEAQPERKPLSAMLQKLVDYIESKLPRSVVDDVKAIGQNMLRAGVREAPIAGEAGPAAPAVETGRAQQQQTQRQ